MADSATITGDPLVWRTQNWLNETYNNKQGYISIDRDGRTGWGTINALMRAFQIELGISNTSTNFGPTTTSRFNTRFPNGIQQQDDNDETEDNIYAIIKGACWCKGYSTGVYDVEITKRFNKGMGSAISELKKDAGCSETSSTVTINVMKALLSMDQFKLTILYGGVSKIRGIQQKLNNKYEYYLGLIPCDGVYSRQMNKGLIKVLQIVEGSTDSGVDGEFGNGTKAKIPLLPEGMYANGSVFTNDVKEEAILLLRYCLCCNGYTNINTDLNTWDENLINTIKEFQNEMLLTANGKADVDTWMALLLTKGNRERPYDAIDTGYTIYGTVKINGVDTHVDRRQILKDHGIKLVGRYISGEEGKQLKFDEAQAILDAGIDLYPIFQRDGEPKVTYYTEAQAILDVEYAYRRARYYCIPKGTIIYFAVDVDMVDSEIPKYALPYFKKLKEELKDYKIGIYGTRNVCTQVMEKKYAETCMVSDASFKYSGNMGFKMPKNWNIDQFDVDVYWTEGIEIDKNIYSKRFPVVTQLSERYFYEGKIQFTGQNFGRGLRYGGRWMRIFVKATPVKGINITNSARVMVTIEALQTPDGSATTATRLYAKLDGETYGLEDTPSYDIHGNPITVDAIKIDSDVEYQLKYYVGNIIKDSNGEEIFLENKDATVDVEVQVYTQQEPFN